MSEIIGIKYGSSKGNKKIIYSKNIEQDMLLMTSCLFKDENGLKSIIELMCENTDTSYIENSRAIDETFALTMCSDNFFDASEYVYYCLLNNYKIIWVPVDYNDISVTLIREINFTNSGQEPEPIYLPTEWQNHPTIKGMITIVISDEEVSNIWYRIHELVDNPHRNLKESVLYEEEVNNFLIGNSTLIEQNGNVFDKRSNIFLYNSLTEYAF